MQSPKRRTNLADAVDDTAPPPPPCFLNASMWRQYLKSAAQTQYSKGEQLVIIIAPSQEPVFNMRFNFCRDCSPSVKDAMAEVGRCAPGHLKAILKERENAQKDAEKAATKTRETA